MEDENKTKEQLLQELAKLRLRISEPEEESPESRWAEEALVESERRYKSLYSLIRLMCDNAPDLIWAKDLDGRYLFVNRAICETLLNASDTEEPIGKTDLFFAERERSAHPENPNRHDFGKICVDSDKVVMSSKKAERFDEYGNVRGEFLYLDVYKTPFWNEHGEMIGTVGCGRVVTEEKRLQEALELKTDEQSLLLDNTQTQIWFLTDAETYGRVNKAHAEFLGKTPEDFRNKSLYEILSKEEADVWIDENIELFQTKKRVHGEQWFNNGKGEPRLLTITKTPKLDDKGNVEFAVCSAEDITDRKRLEELQLQTARFRAVADLAGGVAHNFNNLLQIVIGHLGLALMDLETGDYAEVKEALERVLKSSKLAAGTVRRLQSYAGIRDRGQVPKEEVVDLSAVVRQSVEMSETWWKTAPTKKGREGSLNVRLQDGCLVRGEKNDLFDVAVSLIKNAAEASCYDGDIDVETCIDGDHVVLRVRDAGLGITEENLKKVFNPFFTTKAEVGAGLSLASSRTTVDAHGGQILVESEEGKGTTFTVLLPFVGQEPDPPRSRKRTVTGRHVTVLAIDDEEAMLDLLKSALTRHNYGVLTALSGKEGLDIFNEVPVDLVICDLGMPGVSGWEVGERIRATCLERGIEKAPFILLTGWSGQETEVKKIAESGVDVLMDKPLNIKAILDAVGELVGNGPAKASN